MKRGAPALAVGLGVVLALVFATRAAGSPGSPIVFVAATVALGYLPGLALMRLARMKAAPVERLVLAIVIGLVSSTWLDATLAHWGLRSLFWAWPAAAAAIAYALRERGAASPAPENPRDGLWLVLLIALGSTALFVSPFYYSNLARSADGGLTFHAMPDAVFHLSIAQELTHSVPPTAPFMPGLPLHYHVGADLVLALFARVPGLALPDLAARYLPTLFLGTALGAAFACARAFGVATGLAALTAFLVVFGEDFSFVPALLRGAPQGWPWSVTLLQTPTVVSLFMMNPMLPALALLFAAFLGLARFSQGRGRGWLLASLLCAISLFDVKVFVAAQLLGALGIGSLLAFWGSRDVRLAWLLLPLATVLLPRAAMLAGSQGGGARILLQPGSHVADAVVNLGLAATPIGAGVAALQNGHASPATAVAYAIAVLVFLGLSFGLRCVGVGACMRAITARAEPHHVALAWFVVLGPILSLTISVVRTGAAGGYNNGVWFLLQSKYAAWLFAAEGVAAAWAGARSNARRGLLVAGALALSMPSTLQFFRLQAAETPPGRLDRRVVEVADHLRRSAPKGAVLVAPESVAGPLISLTPCRATLPRLWDNFHLATRGFDVAGRERALAAFWRAWADRAPLAAPLRALAPVDYVVLPASTRETPPDWSETFRNEALVVYSVGPGSGF